MTFMSIDPGAGSGISIFSFQPFGNLIEFGTVKDKALIEDYKADLNKIRLRFGVELAIIENYQNYGKKFVNASAVQTQIRACKEVFPEHIMIWQAQWATRVHGRVAGDKTKRQIAAQIFNRDFRNSHQTDSVLMGLYFINKINGFSQYTRIDPRKLAMAIMGKWHAMPKNCQITEWVREIAEEHKPKFSRIAI